MQFIHTIWLYIYKRLKDILRLSVFAFFCIQVACKPRDSTTCLQNSPDWSYTEHTCNVTVANPEFCTQYGKDFRRCCPESCKTGSFTRDDCDSFDPSYEYNRFHSGTCIYPNEAQCDSVGKDLSILRFLGCKRVKMPRNIKL